MNTPMASTSLVRCACLLFSVTAIAGNVNTASAVSAFADHLRSSISPAAAAAAQPRSDILNARNDEVASLVTAGAWSGVLAAARSIPRQHRTRLAVQLPDVWISAFVDVDTRVCAPAIGGTTMHIEHHVTFLSSDAADRPDCPTLPSYAVEMMVPGRTWHDRAAEGENVTGAPVFSAKDRMVVSHTRVPVTGVLWGASGVVVNGRLLHAADPSSTTHAHGNPTHANRPVFILAESAVECVPMQLVDGGASGDGASAPSVDCIIGGVSMPFPSESAAEEWAAEEYHRSAAERMAALGLRPSNHWRFNRARPTRSNTVTSSSQTPFRSGSSGSSSSRGKSGSSGRGSGNGRGLVAETHHRSGGDGTSWSGPSAATIDGVSAHGDVTVSAAYTGLHDDIDDEGTSPYLPRVRASASTESDRKIDSHHDADNVGEAASLGRRLGLPASYTIGNRAMLAVRLAFADAPTNTITLPNSNTIMNAVVANFARMSFGVVSISLTLPQSIYVIPLNASSQPSAGSIASAAATLLTASGYNPSNYNHFVMLWPWMGW